jgi:hypothetical protein
MTNDLTAALASLNTSLADLRAAHQAAARAIPKLSGARRARAVELVGNLADAIDFTQRLCTVVTGDLRTEQAQNWVVGLVEGTHRTGNRP